MKPTELSTCFCTNDVDACRDFYSKYFAAKVVFDCGWYINVKIGENGPSVQFMQPETLFTYILIVNQLTNSSNTIRANK